MRRDMDLCREILCEVEAGRGVLEPLELPGRDAVDVTYHVEIMAEGGLLKATVGDDPRPGRGGYRISRLTWLGHEFLDTARDDTVWRRAKDRVLGAAGGLAFDVLRTVLLAEVKGRTGLDP